ncbi:MAG: class I SAM-dependent methyltransferase [Bacteroidota bacterium]
MTVKEHYDKHLGNFYSWMAGNFEEKQAEYERYFRSNEITAFPGGKKALDLGAGHGIQSVALAKLGFQVVAVDFNAQLLQELRVNAKGLEVDAVESDIVDFLRHTEQQYDVIVCMGDTLTHLETFSRAKELIHFMTSRTTHGGKIVLAFRDLTRELKEEQRFIPVAQDDKRILTCYLEYFASHVMVHDILHEKENGKWVQKISAYPKLRISPSMIEEELKGNGLVNIKSETINRMVHLIGMTNDK